MGQQNLPYGADMSVRLPSADAYATQVQKKHRWLPMLAPACRCRSLSRWPWASPARASLELVGLPVARRAPATTERIDDLTEFAVTLAGFLTDWHGGPVRVHGDAAVGDLLVSDGRLRAQARDLRLQTTPPSRPGTPILPDQRTPHTRRAPARSRALSHGTETRRAQTAAPTGPAALPRSRAAWSTGIEVDADGQWAGADGRGGL